ncbi:MAG: hypothetical protein IPF48_02825 [Sphingomonadales bacterium]|nr:hypothetical protein [Sphingomonadales bacterium]
MKAGWALMGVALALSACGGRVASSRRRASLPPKPETASAVPTPDQLLVPDIQSRPKRSDEQLKRSEERQNDKFDLPPSL